MGNISKQYIPFIALIILSVFWAFYYQSSNVLNDYGNTKPEWLLLIDGFITLPILCFFCIDDKKQAAIKAAGYACIIVILGSYILPPTSKLIWPYLELGRYLAVALFVIAELSMILTTILAIKVALAKAIDPDLAISAPINRVVGYGTLAKILSFEARIWTYFLFANRIKQSHFKGVQHFSCHQKDGTQSNMLGFILLIAFEIPIAHIVIHFIWSDVAANVISCISALGLVLFIAEYKAIKIRPISVTSNTLIIRYGIFNPLDIPFKDISSVEPHSEFVKRAANTKRYNHSGSPNVKITLVNNTLVYLGVDQPTCLINALNEQRSRNA